MHYDSSCTRSHPTSGTAHLRSGRAFRRRLLPRQDNTTLCRMRAQIQAPAARDADGRREARGRRHCHAKATFEKGHMDRIKVVAHAAEVRQPLWIAAL